MENYFILRDFNFFWLILYRESLQIFINFRTKIKNNDVLNAIDNIYFKTSLFDYFVKAFTQCNKFFVGSVVFILVATVSKKLIFLSLQGLLNHFSALR